MGVSLQIPDLADLNGYSVVFVAKRFFQGVGPEDYNLYAIMANYIRLVDLAVSEYQSGRELVFQFWSTRDSLAIGAIGRAAGYFEACISTVKRSLNYVKVIRSYSAFPEGVRYLFPSGLKILSGEAEGRISQMRHAIQHLEKEISKGHIKEG